MDINNLDLARLCREPEEWPNIEPRERQHIADTLEQAAAIPRLAYHVVALRAILSANKQMTAKRLESADSLPAMVRKHAQEQLAAFEEKIADINNVLAMVQDVPEVHTLLFPPEEEAKKQMQMIRPPETPEG